MAAYILAQIHVTDPGWVEDYIPSVHAMIEEAGGRYLVQAREAEHLEGDSPTPTVTAIIEFPTMDEAKAFYDSPVYRPQLEARLAGSTGDLWLLPGS